MYYLVCYEKETAIVMDDDVDLTNLNNNCSPHLKKFLKKVGKYPITRIDQNYPSFAAVRDNYLIIDGGSKRT